MERKEQMKPENVPSKKILVSLMNRVQKDFTVSLPLFFLKLLSLHFVSSLFVLSLCNQWGLKINSGIDLMHVFMVFGATGCQLLCGGLYLGISLSSILIILPRHEVFLLKKNLRLTLASYILLSTGVLSLMGTQDSLELMTAWMIGAFVFGALSFLLLSSYRYPAFHKTLNKTKL